jgi:hypothetical protein
MRFSCEASIILKEGQQASNGKIHGYIFVSMNRKFLSTTTLLLALLVFLIAVYWGSHRGYFEDDDLDTITWARFSTVGSQLHDVFEVKFPFQPIRPLGYAYYSLMLAHYGLNYAPWAVAILVLGCLNVLLLWLLLKLLGFSTRSSAMATLFWAVNRALFDAWWKPMFIYDVLCTTFALACVALYIKRQWVASFLCLWLAIRSKEIAVVLPVCLAAYEMLLGERRWIRLLPYVVPAAVMGAGGWWFIHTQGRGNYQLGSGWEALWKAISFYARECFQIPYAGLLLPLVLWWSRKERRLAFGLVVGLAAMVIYLRLPNRLLPVYLYWGMTGIAVLVAVAAERFPRAAGALLAFWVLGQGILVRQEARATLAAAGERRAYVAALGRAPDAETYTYWNQPASLRHWGVAAALRLSHASFKTLFPLDAEELPVDRTIPMLVWSPRDLRLHAVPFRSSDFSKLKKLQAPAAWQLLADWPADQAGKRRIEGVRGLRLCRPTRQSELAMELCGPVGAGVRVAVQQTFIHPVALKASGCGVVRLPVPDTRAGMVHVLFFQSGSDSNVHVGDVGFN